MLASSDHAPQAQCCLFIGQNIMVVLQSHAAVYCFCLNKVVVKSAIQTGSGQLSQSPALSPPILPSPAPVPPQLTKCLQALFYMLVGGT